MIPKIIHQIWEGRTEYLGDAYKLLGETWKEHHPDWKYEFWDESRIVDFSANPLSDHLINIAWNYCLSRND